MVIIRKTAKNVGEVISKVDYMSTNVLNALGETFGQAVFKLFSGGKMGDAAKANAATLGISKDSKVEDMQRVDSVLNRVNHLMERIQNTSGDTRQEYIKRAMEFAGDTDSGGNEKLQEMLNETFEKMVAIQGKSDAEINTVRLDEGTLKTMTQASKDSANIMAKSYKDNVKEFAAEAAKEKRKGK